MVLAIVIQSATKSLQLIADKHDPIPKPLDSPINPDKKEAPKDLQVSNGQQIGYAVRLGEELDADYEIFLIPDGFFLRPRKRISGVNTIKVITDNGKNEVFVNGELLSDHVLRAWLGPSAEPILNLQRNLPAKRKAALDQLSP